jgi:uncharacterized protein YlxW (UPF0749 family)
MRIPRSALGLVLVVGVVGFILATAVVTVRAQQSTTAAQRQELLDRISVAESENERIDTEIAARSAAVSALSAAVLPNSAEGRLLSDRLAAAQSAAGYTAISDGGLVLTIADGSQSGRLGRVMDRDLQGITNALWSVGATGIAINGIRMTSTTAIRSAGEAILVDYRPLALPYVITAVGAVDLASRFADSSQGAALRTLRQQYGIEWSLDSTDVELPASAAELPHLALSGQETS